MTRPRRSRQSAPPIAPEMVDAIPGWRRRDSWTTCQASPSQAPIPLTLFARTSTRETLAPTERYAAAIRAALLNGNTPLAESYRQELRQVSPVPPARDLSGDAARMQDLLTSVDRLVALPEVTGFHTIPMVRDIGLDRADVVALARIVALVSYQAAFPAELRPRP